ncbi:MAG TPA: exodeoxyribonuclease V subunit alpha [Candidatus Binataceae bacterium]
MDRLYANLGLFPLTLALDETPDGDAAHLRRTMRQIEAAMPAFNLAPSTAHLAAEIAAFEDDLSHDQRLALIMLIASSIVALNEGSTRLPVTGPEAHDSLARILGAFIPEPGALDAAARVAAISDAIATMLHDGAAASVIARAPEDYRPLLYLAPYLYHQRIRAAEVRLADDLKPRFGPTAALALDCEIVAALADLDDRPRCLGANKLALSDPQRDAIRNATTRRLSLVSGGPGSGKTSIVLAIVRLLVRLGIKPAEIALAASTGKAAHRMGESIREGLRQVSEPAPADLELIDARLEPVTVHRLLGYSPRRETFLHHRKNQLTASIVIVDECSMLDLDLMQRLASALRPDARIVLLGDADQLPSVAAGAVFRDLVAAVQGPSTLDANICTRLTQSYRINPNEVDGNAIFNFVRNVNQGVVVLGDGPTLFQERTSPAEIRFEGVELLDVRGSAIDDFLDRWYGSLDGGDMLAAEAYSYGENGFDNQATEELETAYRHLASSRILCATRVMATGADRINDAMHRRALAAMRRTNDRSRFVAGEPVMFVRNDYDRNLFNGDQGMIARVRRSDGEVSLMAIFTRGDHFEPFHLSAFGDALELCYATTIHKAQGSEFARVAVMMPDRDLPLLSRELLYTAVSRARKSVVLVGDIHIVRTAAARKATRYSGLAELLDPAFGASQSSGGEPLDRGADS